MFSQQSRAGIRQSLAAVLISIGTFITADAASTNGRLCLIPVPKNIDVESGTITLKPPFRVIAEPGDESNFIQWLKNDLRQTFNWQSTTDSAKANSVIEFKYQDLKHGNEAYKIEIMPGKIEIFFAAPEAGYRAVGRLLSILENDFTKINPDGKLTCPKLKIFDWPDMPRRGMNLQMAYPGLSSVTEMTMIRRSIDTMARLGLNVVFYEIGGRFESFKHPEVTVKEQWTQAQLRELVRYAKARGITPCPAINSIGHTDRSPQIFILKDIKWNKRAMDITNPDFCGVYFSILDELSDIFEHPPFFCIGTDESDGAISKIISKSGIPGDTLYADFVNNTSRHLSKDNIRTVIYQDMLFTPDQVNSGEPANGKDTVGALKNLDRNIIVAYWCYAALERYRGMEYLVKENFEVWPMPWIFKSNNIRLIQDAYKLKCTSALGSTWDWGSNVGAGFVWTAETSWNAAVPVMTDIDDAYGTFNRFFHRRQNNAPVLNAKTLPFQGGVRKTYQNDKIGKVLSAGRVEFPIDKIILAEEPRCVFPLNPAAVKEVAVSKDMLILLDPKRTCEGVRLAGMDMPKLENQAILYTPLFGERTGTNIWSDEWIINNNRIEKVVPSNNDGGGNSVIPESGGVICAHASGNDSKRWLFGNINAGDAAQFVVRGCSDDGNAEITTTVLAGINGFALLMTSDITVFGKKTLLGKIIVKYSSGICDTRTLEGDFLVRNMPGVYNGLSYWIAWQDAATGEKNRIAAYEWQKTAGMPVPSEITVVITPEGKQLGLGILSGIYW